MVLMVMVMVKIIVLMMMIDGDGDDDSGGGDNGADVDERLEGKIVGGSDKQRNPKDMYTY